MPFFNTRRIAQLMTIIILVLIGASVADVYRSSGKTDPMLKAPGEGNASQPSAAQKDGNLLPPEDSFSASVDAGSLQDEGAKMFPMEKTWLERIKKRYEGVSGQPLDKPQVITGRGFYGEAGPLFDWACGMELKGAYKAYMPVFDMAEWVEDNLEYSIQDLDYIDREALENVLEKGRRQHSYAESFFRLSALGMVMERPSQADIYRAHALNGLAPALDPERSGLTFRTILDLSAGDPDDPSFLLEQGRALIGMALAGGLSGGENLFSEAEETLRTAYEKDPERLDIVYALARAAAGNKNISLAEKMLRKAAAMEAGLDRSVVADEPVFRKFSGQTWFLDVVKLFPAKDPETLSGAAPGKWVREQLDAAMPDGKMPRGRAYPAAAHNLASNSLHQGSPEADKLLIKEIDRLYSMAEEINDPPLNIDDYFVWISVIRPPSRDCSPEAMQWGRKTIDVSKAGLARNKTNGELARFVFYSLSEAGYCVNKEERPGLVEEGRKILADFEPEDIYGSIQIHDSWSRFLLSMIAYDTAPVHEGSLEGVFAELESDLAKAVEADDRHAEYSANFALAECKMQGADLLSEPGEAHALLNSAADHADANKRRLTSLNLLFEPSPDDAHMFGALAARMIHDPEKAGDLARASLRILSRKYGDVDFEDGELLMGLSSLLRVLGTHEKDPALKREIFYIGASLAMQAVLFEPYRNNGWNMWALHLCALAELYPDGEKTRISEIARTIFMNMEAAYPGTESYNLGCLEALRGNPEKAREWLERAKSFGTLPSRVHLLEDPDMDSLREFSWFVDILPEK